MYLIVAVIIAIFIFLGLYAKTVNEYFALLRKVQPLISGEFKCAFLYSSIKLMGNYKGREVVCALEQLKQGADVLSVKIKLQEASPEKLALNADSFANKVVLSGGWLMPRFHFPKDKFNTKSFVDNLDRLSLICDNLERQIRIATTDAHTSAKITYKTQF